MSHRGRLWSAMLIVAAILRVATLPAYPLHDTTEARYAEIARLMLASGDWITPQIEVGVPFWGKPPLSFWLTAGSFQLFGLGELAARLPAFLLVLFVLWLIYVLAKRTLSHDTALGAAAIFLTTAIGFVAAGAVMTDAALIAGTTLSMTAFWQAAILRQQRWRYLFFIGIVIGVLAKGPIALILTTIPVAIWLLCNKQLAWSLRCLPWIPGFILLALITLPWYALAEWKTPGFIEYFLIGEHWLRYVETGWDGDLYGKAHAAPRGTIWLLGIAAALPWSLLALYAAARFLVVRPIPGALAPLQTYLLLWTISPLCVFTLAGNILPAYVLPGMPAFAILLSDWLARQNRHIQHVAWLVPLLIVAAILTTSSDVIGRKSQRDLISHHASLGRSDEIVYFPMSPFSANFYSRGTAMEIRSETGMLSFLEMPGHEFIAIRRDKLQVLPPGISACLRIEAEFPRHLLLEKLGDACHDGTGAWD